MEVQHNSRALRPRHNGEPPAKQIVPAAVKKTVSVAAVFKQPPQTSKNDKIRAQKPALKLIAQHASDDKVQSHKSRSSPHSPHKAGSRVSKKKSALHPLAIAFKNTSDSYRRQLYKSTTLKINNTLATLTHTLYDSTLRPISSSINPEHSPIRLTIPAKFARAAHKLYAPISAYKIGLTRTNTDGTQTKFPATLEARMADYAHLIASQKEEIEKLRDKWEVVVGEIWKVGVQVIGAEGVESVLFVKKDKGKGKEKARRDVEPESSLFVGEQETSPPAKKTKKRVTFVEDVQDMPRSDLAFLYQPTRLRVGPVADAPNMPVLEIGALEKRVKEMGQKEYAELKKAEGDYKAYWQKKNQRLAQVFGED
ncbi:hypothetical protein HBH53_185080 [Parastagonospora nodorum]|nr:hypothetical protein HBH53_185080 [Parastagonospora nodorum]